MNIIKVKKLSLKKLKKTASAITLNLVTDDEKQIEFLTQVAHKMDQTKGLSIHLDMTLRLAELHLKYGHYTEAEELIHETERLIPLPPDPNDQFLCQSSLNFLVMKLDVLMFRQKFGEADHAFQQFNQVAQQLKLEIDKRIDMLTTANWATLLYVQGLKSLEIKDFVNAKKFLYDSFKQYENVGDKKRTNPIPFFWLASILSRDPVDPSQSPEFAAHLNHPYISPMKKLCDSYSYHHIPEIESLRRGYDTIFCTELRPIYRNFFNLIIEYCVESAIIKICLSYSKISFDFLAKEIKFERKSIERIAANLIANKKLYGLIDDDQGAIIVLPKQQTSSAFLDTILYILPSLEILTHLR